MKCPFLNNLWHDLANKEDHAFDVIYQEDWTWLEPVDARKVSYENLLESEWDEEFFQEAMKTLRTISLDDEDKIRNWARNRMVMGALRYGLLADKEYEKYDLLSSIFARVELGSESQTIEPFIDAYNLCYLNWLKLGKKENELKTAQRMIRFIYFGITEFWSLGSVDDGIHTELEK